MAHPLQTYGFIRQVEDNVSLGESIEDLFGTINNFRPPHGGICPASVS